MKWWLAVPLLLLAVNLPTTVTTTPAVVTLNQNAYRWYGNLDGLDPTTPLAAENTRIDTPSSGSQLRLRMNLKSAGGLSLPAGTTFTIQYSNSTSGTWTDVSTSTAWAFFDNPSVADGQIIVTTLLSSSTVGESYGESNPSAASPNQLLSGDYGEWDWALVNNFASTSASWFFRVTYASGTVLDAYNHYPELAAVPPPPPGGGGGGTSGSVTVGGGGGTGYPYQQTSTLPASPPLLPPAFQVADFNGDNRIDIVDLSILLFYYNRSGPAALRYDLNHDGIVGLADISILMYYWTN